MIICSTLKRKIGDKIEIFYDDTVENKVKACGMVLKKSTKEEYKKQAKELFPEISDLEFELCCILYPYFYEVSVD